MESRKKLYKIGSRTDSGLNRRVQLSRANQRSRRLENFSSHRELIVDSPVEIAATRPNINSQLNEYRMKRNMKKVRTIQEEKVPFFNVVPSGIWLEKEEPIQKKSSKINLDQTPVRKILASSRSVTKKTVEKIIQQTASRKKLINARATPKIRRNSITKAKKRVLSELNSNVPSCSSSVQSKKKVVTSVAPATVTKQEPQRQSTLNETFDMSIEPNGNNEIVEEILANPIPPSPVALPPSEAHFVQEFTSSPKPTSQIVNLQDQEEVFVQKEQSSIVRTYMARLDSKKEMLLTLIGELESVENREEEKNILVHQVNAYLNSKPQTFEKLLKEFDEEDLENACKPLTEEDIDNYWYLISKEMDAFKKTMQKMIGGTYGGSVARRRSKRSLILDSSLGPKRSIRLLKNSETPKHNPSCYGCTSVTSASKACTPKSARRRTRMKSDIGSPSLSFTTPQSSAKIGRKLFDLND